MNISLSNPMTFVMAVALSSFVGVGTTKAHEGHGSHASSPPAARVRQNARSVNPDAVQNPYAAATQPPAPVHGGQLVEGQQQYFEVVFAPRETRVYLYDASFRPISARQVRGEILMQVRGNPQVFRYPLNNAAPPAGQTEPDYLVAVVDVTQIRDGDMQVTFDLTGLPDPRQQTVRFTQTFALARGAAIVTIAPLTAADREGVARQGICPVTEGAFDHGEPIKLMIGNQALYVCCQECVDAVKKNPQVYLQKAARTAASRPTEASGPVQVSATRATDQDRAAIQAQRLCPVMNKPLGDHGVPWKVSVGRDVVFVCCAGCIRKVEQNPQRYLARAQR